MDVKNWLVPSVTFVMFLYFMMFTIIYVIKVGGPNVSMHDGAQKTFKAESDAELKLKKISENIRN